MKLKKILLIALMAVLSAGNLFSQLSNSGTSLIANKNDHSTNNQYKYSACWGYVAPNGREYAIIGCQPGTAFYDITDTTNVHEVGFVASTNPGNTNNLWREMKVYSHYAYLVSEVANSGIQIVDLQYLPDSIHYLGKFVIPGHSSTHSISQSGPYLYLNGCNASFGQGVTIADLSVNPASPVRRGSWNTQYVHDCRVINDTIWTCNIYDPPGTVTVLNGANKDNLTFIANWVNAPNQFPHNCALSPDHHHIFTTDETTSPPGKLKVWNITNLSNVTLETTWQPTGITTCVVHNVEVYGNYAVIAHYEAGIRIVNIANPTAPTEVAWYDTYPTANAAQELGCWGVYMFPSGKIIGSDTQSGLFVIRVTVPLTGTNNNNNSIPKDFALSQNFPNPFNPSTTINYSLPKNTYATIKVYDALGKQVALLEDSYKQAGSYSVTYDASRLSSGMYFYSLTTNDGFSQTKKMVLVK